MKRDNVFQIGLGRYTLHRTSDTQFSAQGILARPFSVDRQPATEDYWVLIHGRLFTFFAHPDCDDVWRYFSGGDQAVLFRNPADSDLMLLILGRNPHWRPLALGEPEWLDVLLSQLPPEVAISTACHTGVSIWTPMLPRRLAFGIN
ncbi:MAG TPA: hypothetical protein VMW87_03515 [Spirochaetia bacterium]|nr:hypothetical protein [Spirochaetia bacterium]